MTATVGTRTSRVNTSTTRAWAYVFATGATGLAMLAVSWAVSAIGWAFADLPDAANSVEREATLALFGLVFVALSIAGRAIIRRRFVGDVDRSKFGTAAVVLSVAAFVVAVVGAARFAAHAIVDQLRPVLGEGAVLNVAGSTGLVILVAAVALSGAGLVVLALGRVPVAARS